MRIANCNSEGFSTWPSSCHIEGMRFPSTSPWVTSEKHMPFPEVSVISSVLVAWLELYSLFSEIMSHLPHKLLDYRSGTMF